MFTLMWDLGVDLIQSLSNVLLLEMAHMSLAIDFETARIKKSLGLRMSHSMKMRNETWGGPSTTRKDSSKYVAIKETTE